MKFPSEWVIRWAWPIIIVFSVGSLLFLIPLRHVEIDPEIKNQLPPDMLSRRNVQAIEQRFGGSELVMIVLQAEDVLAPSTLQRVRKLSEALARVPMISRVTSPFTIPEIAGGDDGMMTVQPAIAAVPETPEAREALRARLRANPLVAGNVLARDFSAAAVIGTLSSAAKDRETSSAVRAVLDGAPGPEKVLVGGMPEIRQRVSDDIRSDIRRFAPIGLAVMLGFLFFALRQARAVFIPFSVQLLAIVVSLGLIPVLGWKIQMVTVTLPVMLLAIGNDHTVHLVARYQDENQPGRNASAAQLTVRVLRELAFPMLTAGITTVAGFLCLLTHVVIPAAQLGILASVGLGFVMIAAVSFAPAMLAKLPLAKPIRSQNPSESTWLDRGLEKNARFVLRHKRWMVAASVLFTLLASAGLPRLEVDTNPINYYPASAPVAATARAIGDHFGGSTEISVMVEGDIQDPALVGKLDALERELRAMPQVGHTLSIAQIVRTMNRAVTGADAIPSEREGIAQLFLLYSLGGKPEDFERLVDFDYRHALLTARVRSLSTGQISAVVDRIQAFARRELPGTRVTVGGFGAVFAELVGVIVEGQTSSLILSFVLVFLLNALGFWSLAAGAWSMLPLAIAVPALFGLMGTFGIELNIVTAMLSSIMIGVGVDYTVHFLWRFREERQNGLGPEEAAHAALTSVGRGIVFNALAVVLGFSILFFSNFLPVRFFGFLVTVSISICMLAAMVLMPPLMVSLDPRFARPRAPKLEPSP